MTAVQRADHLASSHVQGGEEAGGPVAHVVMAATLRGAGHHVQDRPEPVQRLDLRFLVDAQDCGPLRRVQIQTDDVSDLLDENGSVDNLKLSARCGCSPNARQIRLTDVWDIPVAFAIDLVDQCVASAGFPPRS
jgi:hypothetical protein